MTECVGHMGLSVELLRIKDQIHPVFARKINKKKRKQPVFSLISFSKQKDVYISKVTVKTMRGKQQ